MTEMNADERMGRLEVGLESLKQKVDGLNQGMENFRGEVISRFDGMDGRLDGVDGRFDGMDAKIDRLSRNVLIAGIVIFPPVLATLGAAIAGIFLSN